MVDIRHFAKIMVTQGLDCGQTRQDFDAEISKRAEATRTPGETLSREQLFTRFVTNDETGRLLFKASMMAPVGKPPIQAAQDLKPEPAGPASKELNDLAREMARAKNLSFEQAHSRLQSDPTRKDLVARVRREELDATREVHNQRGPIWAAQRG